MIRPLTKSGLVLLALALVGGLLAVPAAALAADQADIENSVEDGLAWLASEQNPDGSWGTSDQVGYTALVLAAFCDHATRTGLEPLSGAYEHSAVVQDGLDYIFSKARTVAIGPQPAGDPDGDGDGFGVYFYASSSHHANYETGCALMAIAASNAPSRTVTAAGSVNGWTYERVAQNVIDYLAFMQRDGDTGRGGWYYSPSDNGTGGSDNSIAGWVALGLGYAQASAPYGFGLTIPQFVLDELDIWIDYIQNDVDGDDTDGGSGYGSPNSWVNSYKTGHLLYQMGLVGDSPTTARVQDALDYLERHWNDDTMDWIAQGWRDEETGTPWYIATAAIMKGLVYLGIDEFNGIDWFEEFSDAILSHQSPDGRWMSPGYPHNDIVATAWALLTIQKAAGVAILQAGFSASPTMGPGPLEVRFKDESVGDITSWRWDFGDGSSSRSKNPTHVYREQGFYDVTLTVSDGRQESTITRENAVRVTSTAKDREVEPARMGVSYLMVDPIQVLPGQQVTVSANVCNSGGERGSHGATLSVNGTAEQSQSVAVSAGSCKQVTFRVAKAVPGTYQVSIDGMQGQFTVLAPRTVQAQVPSQQSNALGTWGIVAIISVAIVLVLALVLMFRR